MARKRRAARHAAAPAPDRDPAEGSREAVEADLERHDSGEGERRVDEAVDMTFPASDPTSTGRATGTEPAARPADRKPPAVKREEIEGAKRAGARRR